jgi:hypothetical protein
MKLHYNSARKISVIEPEDEISTTCTSRAFTPNREKMSASKASNLACGGSICTYSVVNSTALTPTYSKASFAPVLPLYAEILHLQ